MKPILLIRHGKAEDTHPAGDGARALTAEGRTRFRKHARRLVRLAPLEGVATSPLVRAVQTAEILAEAYGLEVVVVREELDAARASAESVIRVARELGPGWALVGHNPSLAEALGRLLALPEPPSFKKGAAAALEPTGDRAHPWKLVWMFPVGDEPRKKL